MTRVENEQGQKFDQEKLRYDLIPTKPLELLARVYTEGARKYSDRNWELGIDYSRVYAAIQRHLNAFWAGEDYDAETGVPHVINAAWGCFALCEYMATHPERDDRPCKPQQIQADHPSRGMCPVWPGCECTTIEKCTHFKDQCGCK